MITTLSLMEEAANCSNISLIPASGRKIIIFYCFYQWFHLYQGVGCSMDRDFFFLSYVMAAIPVQLLICGSYNYFRYWYKIIINHKTAPHACLCLFLSPGVSEFGHVSFRKRKKKCIMWLDRPEWEQGGESHPSLQVPPASPPTRIVRK